MNSNKSPLRYPGGKTRACKILDEIFTNHFDPNNFSKLISPFLGGGSFEFYLQGKYSYKIVGNDKFGPLYNFWKICKEEKDALVSILKENHSQKVTKSQLQERRRDIMSLENDLEQAVSYFMINRCSFSGSTLCGGFSDEAIEKRFTESSIKNIAKLKLDNFEINNEDFSSFIETNYTGEDIMFLDPPYYLEKGSKLYGNKGDMHETFDHQRLFEELSDKSNWMMTYNNCEYIKDLYQDFEIIETNWTYGMNKSKESSEIVILSVVN